jgi:precorrin-6A/cobalt-precorrin-6A reductase
VRRLLILGGTTEAAELARRAVVAFAGQLDVITSLAGRLPNHPDLPGRLRVGGFGGAAGLSRYLQAERIDLLVDATHPFAAAISHNAAEACAALGVPRLMLVRPPWRPGQGDCWLEVDSLEEAATLLPGMADRVFLTTGPGGIEAFAAASGVWFLVRLFTQPAVPLPLSEYETLVARPPFSRESERELMRRHRIDTLVTKNSGGPTEAKLRAALDLGVRIVMVRRPPLMPAGHPEQTADNVRDALAWVGRHL